MSGRGKDTDPVEILSGMIDSGTSADRIMLARKDLDNVYAHVVGLPMPTDPERFMVAIRKDYGGGAFRARIYGDVENDEGETRRQYKPGAWYFSIEGAPKYKKHEPDEDAAPSGALELRLARIEEALTREPQRDASEAAVSLARTMMESQFAALKPLLERPSGPDATDLLKTFIQGMRAGERRGESSGGSDPYAAMFDRVLTTLQAHPQAGAQAAPAPAALPAPSPAPPGPPPELPAHVVRALPMLAELPKVAAMRVAPERVAAGVLAYADDPENDVDRALLGLVVADPMFVDDVVAAEPAFNRCRSYLEAVLAELEDMLTPDDEGDDDGDE